MEYYYELSSSCTGFYALYSLLGANWIPGKHKSGASHFLNSLELNKQMSSFC